MAGQDSGDERGVVEVGSAVALARVDTKSNGAMADPSLRRWRHEQVAKQIGINPQIVRARIAAQRKRLEAYGPLSEANGAFMLSREQARDIAGQYDTDEAARIRRDNVHAFSRVDALEAMFRETAEKQDAMIRSLEAIQEAVTRQRRDASATLVRHFTNFVRIELRGFCPWCNRSSMFRDAENTEVFSDLVEIDHFDGNRQNNEDHNFWPLCKPCHKRKTHERTRETTRAAFNAHQIFWDRFDAWMRGNQGPPTAPINPAQLRINEIKSGPHWKP
jgi:hypothetical protein